MLDIPGVPERHVLFGEGALIRALQVVHRRDGSRPPQPKVVAGRGELRNSRLQLQDACHNRDVCDTVSHCARKRGVVLLLCGRGGAAPAAEADSPDNHRSHRSRR